MNQTPYPDSDSPVMQRRFENLVRFFGDDWLSVFKRAILYAIASLAGYVCLLILLGNQISARAPIVDTDAAFRFRLICFLAALALYAGLRWLAFVNAQALAERMITNLWIRIYDKLRRLELRPIEKLDRGDAYTCLSGDINSLSQQLFRILAIIQGIVPALIYLGFLFVVSFSTACLAVAGIICLVFLYMENAKLVKDMLRKVKSSEGQLLNSLHGVFYGFKELKLNSQRKAALLEEVRVNGDQSKLFRLQAALPVRRPELFAQVAVFIMLGTVVFIFPQYGAIDNAAAMTIVVLLFFLVSPLTSGTILMDAAVYAEAILTSMYELEGRVDDELARWPDVLPATNGSPYTAFQKLTFEGLRFSYREGQEKTFSLGPLDLQVRRGDTVFIVGGNGAGKSTALKLLTGLYRPDEGRILVDGKPVPWSLIAGYRAMVATVFADFHLFDRFYGMENVDETRVAELLHFFELDAKVSFSSGRFSTQDLSTGQRKRLALISSLMEDREVYFLDEWAADQDRHFRHFYYRTIIPELKRQGKTVIAITHDEQYLDAADKVVQLELGRLIASRDIEVTP